MKPQISSTQWMGMDRSHITPLNEYHGLVEEAKNAFLQMQTAAIKDGIDLQIASSFRSFDRQLAIWQSKWHGEKAILDINDRPLNTNNLKDLEKIHGIMTWSALPGASRHHWGTDLDVYDKRAIDNAGTKLQLVNSEYQENGPCYQLSQWLTENGHKYGFYRPYQDYNGGVAPEAWHLSYQPIASEIISNLNVEDLRSQLTNTSIGGKNDIIQHLPSLFARYTLNGNAL